MSQEAVERVLGRLLTDKWFRFRAADSLKTVSILGGMSAEHNGTGMLEGVEQSYIARFAERLDPGLLRTAVIDNEQSPPKGR